MPAAEPARGCPWRVVLNGDIECGRRRCLFGMNPKNEEIKTKKIKRMKLQSAVLFNLLTSKHMSQV
jgi:hypothetical protein